MGIFSYIAVGYLTEEFQEGKRKHRAKRKSAPKVDNPPLPLPNEQELVQRIIQLPHHHRVERAATHRPFKPPKT